MSQFIQSHRLPLLLICAVAFYLIGAELAYSVPEAYPNPILGDFAAYATVLSQSDYPSHFERDPLYGSGAQSQIRRANTWLYMQILEGLHRLAGEDLVAAARVYSILLRVVYLLGMYFCLEAMLKDQGLALMLSVVSLKASGFMASGNSWGFAVEMVIPFHLFTALSPYYLWWVYRRWFGGGAGLEVFVGGLVAGLGLNFVHSVSAVAFIQLVGGMAVFLWLSRRVKGWTIPLFGLGVLVTLPLYLPNRPDAYALSFPAAQEIIGFGQRYSMIYPWRFRSLQPLGWAGDTLPFYETFLLVYPALSLLSYLSHRRLGYAFFVLLQACFFSLFVNIGALPILLAGLSLFQIWRGEWAGWQKYLWVWAGFALWLGVFEQMLLFWLWQRTSDTNLVSYLFEWARMSHFFYPVFYALLGHNLVFLLRHVRAPLERAWLVGGLGVLVWSNLNLIPYPLNEGADFSLILVLAVLGMAWIWGVQPLGRQYYALVGAFMLGAGFLTWVYLNSLALSSLWLVLFSVSWTGLAALYLATRQRWQPQHILTLACLALAAYAVVGDFPVQNRHGALFSFSQAIDDYRTIMPTPLPYQITSDYLEMVVWLKSETPSNSLLHVSDFDRSIRYFGQRSLLSASQDWVLSSFTGPDPQMMQELEGELRRNQYDPASFFPLLKGYGVDYLILRKDFAGWAEPYPEPIAFENETYLIYKLAEIGDYGLDSTINLSAYYTAKVSKHFVCAGDCFGRGGGGGN